MSTKILVGTSELILICNDKEGYKLKVYDESSTAERDIALLNPYSVFISKLGVIPT